MKKFETCEHVESAGQVAVYVRPTCPNALMVLGSMVSTKARCEKCEHYRKAKGD